MRSDKSLVVAAPENSFAGGCLGGFGDEFGPTAAATIVRTIYLSNFEEIIFSGAGPLVEEIIHGKLRIWTILNHLS